MLAFQFRLPLFLLAFTHAGTTGGLPSSSAQRFQDRARLRAASAGSMADDHEDDDDEDQTKQAGQSNVEGAGQADLQVKHELVGAVKLSQYDVPQQSKHVLFTEKFPKNSKQGR